MSLTIKFRKVVKNAKVPTRSKEGDAGYDLYSCERFFISPMERRLIPIGICLEIPAGYYGRIAPRSGLALKKGIDILAGVIDSGYREELGVLLVNLNLPDNLFQNSAILNTYNRMFGSPLRFEIKPGDRIAQLIIEKCHVVNWEESDLSESERNAGGFGSTGA